MPGFDVLDPQLDLRKNYFLEASAGTGKTFTIENIVVRLIEEGISIDQILIVTFTRAATVELKSRIRNRLEEKKQHEALSAFDEAKIFTIHGFCFHILKEYALETGFPLNQTEESASPDTFKRIIKDFLRTELTQNEIHPKQLEKVLRKSQNDLDKFLSTLSRPVLGSGRPFSEIFHEIQSEVKNLNFSRDKLLDDLLGVASCFRKMCDRSKQIKPENEKGLVHFADLFRGNFDTLFDLSIVHMVPENLLKNKGPYPEFLEKLNQKLIPLLIEISNTEAILNRLAKRAQDFLEHVIEKEDLFFFDDLLTSMQTSVQNEDVAEKIRSNYQAVLIDEFQDTDPIQWEVFSTLFLDHKPLYLVGDPKQSIYRFRGADLYTYMKAREALGEEARATLTKNFRSVPALVQGLNTLFSRTPDLITLPKLGQSLPIIQIEAARDENEHGGINFCQADDESPLFSFIIQEIKKLHQQGIPYTECAVLVKDRYQAKRFCDKCPLPVVPKRSESLLESDALEVLEDLCAAAYNPRERHHVIKALGGPLFGLTVEELSSEWQDHIQPFYEYHHLFNTKGVLALFQSVIETCDSLDENLYLDMRQLVEIIAENTQSIDQILPFIQQLKLQSPEAEQLKTRAKCGDDAIQVMTMHMSKGLEFEAVFPIGLISRSDLKEPEALSEKMRQLYVAFTRAKRWLYLPVIEKENTPMQHFLTQCLKHETLATLIDQNENFSLTQCQPDAYLPHVARSAKKVVFPKLPQLNFTPIGIHSYSSLLEKKETFPHLQIPENEMPAGPETGTLLHKIFENLPFEECQADLHPFLTTQLKGTHLEPWLETVHAIVHNTLRAPLPAPSGPFSLVDVEPHKMIKEMEFLYPSEEPKGFLKGFVDLFFEYQGRYYIIDWKSNFLNDYRPQAIQGAIEQHMYDLQAKLYKTAIKKYLKIFNDEEKFECSFYLFLRGLSKNHSDGIYFFL